MSESRKTQVIDLMTALKASLAPRHQNVAEPFRSVLEGIAPPVGWDKAETSTDEPRGLDEVDEAKEAVRETAEQITIRVLKAELTRLVIELDIIADCTEESATNERAQDAVDTASALLARLEMPV